MAHSLSMNDDTYRAYLFECDAGGLFAVSLDPSGTNIPQSACDERWRYRASFELGIHSAVPARISPEPILRGIRDTGFYIWRDGTYHGTGQ
jgi:hypothetical protein